MIFHLCLRKSGSEISSHLVGSGPQWTVGPKTKKGVINTENGTELCLCLGGDEAQQNLVLKGARIAIGSKSRSEAVNVPTLDCFTRNGRNVEILSMVDKLDAGVETEIVGWANSHGWITFILK